LILKVLASNTKDRVMLTLQRSDCGRQALWHIDEAGQI
jgi:hypothetical protein